MTGYGMDFRLVISPIGMTTDYREHQTRIIVGELGGDNLLNEVSFLINSTGQVNDGVPPEDSVIKLSREELVRLQAAINYVLT
jgi:hypothetical protein